MTKVWMQNCVVKFIENKIINKQIISKNLMLWSKLGISPTEEEINLDTLYFLNNLFGLNFNEYSKVAHCYNIKS